MTYAMQIGESVLLDGNRSFLKGDSKETKKIIKGLSLCKKEFSE